MLAIPTTEPELIVAGTTAKWSQSIPDFPASAGWTLRYYFRSTAGGFDITAAANGDDYLINEPPSSTGNYTAGTFSWVKRVSNADSSESYELGSGTTVVRADFAQQSQGFDARTFAAKALDSIESAIATSAGRDEFSIDIDGRIIVYRSLSELMKARTLFTAEVEQQRAAEQIAKGWASGNRVLTRFRTAGSGASGVNPFLTGNS